MHILKENLKRLNFKTNTTNLDFKKINEKIKYNFVIVDAPCSAVGTIRKNPEIFFRKKEPDLKKLTNIPIVAIGGINEKNYNTDFVLIGKIGFLTKEILNSWKRNSTTLILHQKCNYKTKNYINKKKR